MLSAQETDFDFKKPGPADFAYTKCNFDENADVVILNEEGNLTINYNTAKIDVKKRLKILTEKGKEKATITIKYFDGGKRIENIFRVKAYTINGNAENPIEIEVDKEEIFDIDLNEYWKEIRFTFPAVQVGSILEFKYTIETLNLWFIDSWEFQHEFPTERSFFSISNNTTMGYKMLLQGEKLVALGKKGKSSNNKMELTDIPSFDDIQHVYNYKDHIEKISFQNDQSPNSWTGLVNDKLNNLKANRRKSAIKEMAKNVQKGANQDELFNNLVKYVKSNIAWNGFYGQWSQKNINQIIKDKEGNSADVNYLFHLLAVELGLNTELMMVSTRENGKMLSVFPYLGQFNQLVNLISFKNGKNMIIDASRINLNEPAFFPLNLANHYGLVLNDRADFVQVSLPISEYTFKHTYEVKNDEIKILKNSKWTGYFNQSSQDELSFYEPKNVFNQTFDWIEEKPTKEFRENAYFSNSKMQGELSPENIILLENPILDFIQNFELKEASRNTLVEFPFPLFLKGNLIIDIPEGYTVELPEHYSNSEIENLIYSQNFALKNDKIVIQYNFFLKQVVFDPEQYIQLKNIIDETLTKASAPIILKKET